MRPRLTARRRRLGALVVPVLVAPALAACSSPVGSTSVRTVAWVATGASVTLPGMDVTPVNLATRRIQPKVPVGSLPAALAYTPGDKGLLVVTQGDDMLHEIDPATHDVVHSVGVGIEPDAVVVAPGGPDNKGIALVANLDSNSVTPVALGTWRAGPPVPVGTQPVAIAVAIPSTGPDTAFVADFGSNDVTPIDLSTMQPGAPIPVGPGPQAVAAASGQVLVGNFSNRTLTQIDASTFHPEGAVALPINPIAITVNPSGTTVYVCGGAGLVPVTVYGLVVHSEIALPDVAQGVALTPDGSTAWVTQQAGSVVPVALASATPGRPVRLGGHPSAIVIGAG